MDWACREEKCMLHQTCSRSEEENDEYDYEKQLSKSK